VSYSLQPLVISARSMTLVASGKNSKRTCQSRPKRQFMQLCRSKLSLVSSAPSLSAGLLGLQSGLHKPLSNSLDVLFLFERLPGEMLAEGVFWIDRMRSLSKAAAVSYLPASKYATPRKCRCCGLKAGSRRVARSSAGIASSGRPDNV
jgi:hypothetical protein